MKKILLLIVAVGISFIVSAQKQPKFFIICTTKGDTSSKYAGSFERVMASYLTDAFPCSRSKTQGDIHTKIGREKLNQFLGGETNWGSFCDDLACDYLLNLELSDFLSNQVVVSASVIDYKKVEPLVRDAKYGARNYASIKQMVNEVSENIADKLQEYEICAYEGKVTIEVESEKEETTSSSIPCDGGMIVIQTKIKTKMNLNWELNKNGRRKGDGNVTYDMNEKTETTINNPCYICPDGQKTIAQINEKKDVEAKASGLTNESVSEGQKVADCRIKIVFLEDGTYNILIEATSQKGNMKTTIDKKVNAPCAAGKNEEPEEPRNNEIDVPLKVVLGPYKGTAEDKVLSQDETKDLSQGKEKATAKINFSLTRQ